MNDWILHIDTASNRGMAMISHSGKPVITRVNDNAFDHAAFVQPAIEEMLKESGITPQELACIAVANGPGSYTGLRVGLAAAKGLCYAWNKPLLTLSSLRIMAIALQHQISQEKMFKEKNVCFAPLIDARRMEVFFALFQHPELNILAGPTSAILDETFLHDYLSGNRIYFSGDGSDKWKSICRSENAVFEAITTTDHAFAQYAQSMACKKEWSNIAYCEPFYMKDFYTPVPSSRTYTGSIIKKINTIKLL